MAVAFSGHDAPVAGFDEPLLLAGPDGVDALTPDSLAHARCDRPIDPAASARDCPPAGTESNDHHDVYEPHQTPATAAWPAKRRFHRRRPHSPDHTHTTPRPPATHAGSLLVWDHRATETARPSPRRPDAPADAPATRPATPSTVNRTAQHSHQDQRLGPHPDWQPSSQHICKDAQMDIHAGRCR